jgi:uncharacterized protein (DUF305 family)
MKKSLILLCATLAACCPAQKEAAHNDGHEHKAPASNAAAEANSPSDKAYLAANAKMHADMNIVLTGNADADFMRSMIPHHEGAVAMAKVALEHGKDPEVRKLAEDVIKAQQAEIAMMKSWLAKNGGKAPVKAAGEHDNH